LCGLLAELLLLLTARSGEHSDQLNFKWFCPVLRQLQVQALVCSFAVLLFL
jgi:hypothetical protein